MTTYNLPSYQQVADILTKINAANTNINTSNERINTANTNINTANDRIGAQGSAASNASAGNLHAKVNWILNNLANSGGGIKSVQRGIAVTTGNGVTVQLSPIDPLKSFVILYAAVYGEYQPFYRNLTSNSVALYVPSTSAQIEVDYQVIELK